MSILYKSNLRGRPAQDFMSVSCKSNLRGKLKIFCKSKTIIEDWSHYFSFIFTSSRRSVVKVVYITWPWLQMCLRAEKMFFLYFLHIYQSVDLFASWFCNHLSLKNILAFYFPQLSVWTRQQKLTKVESFLAQVGAF